MTVSADLRHAFAPTGVLRVAINLGNPILANAGADGVAVGVSVDLATALAEQLGVPLALLQFEAATKSVTALATAQADIGFFAIDPARGAEIAFTAPYVLIEGFYMVRAASPIDSNEQVDAPGQRVVVGKGSAYDLFLTRALKRAEIVRVPTFVEVAQTFMEDDAAVAAGIKQQLQGFAAGTGGLRLLDQRFMVIEQAMGLAKSRGPQAAADLSAFVEQAKAGGAVAAALTRHRIAGAAVAPLAAG